MKPIRFTLAASLSSLFMLNVLTACTALASRQVVFSQSQIKEENLKSQSFSGLVGQVDNIAQQITVLINSRQSGNGSGVIVAKEGNTYYVLTADHVVKQPDEYEVVTPDGQRYKIDSQTVTQFEGADIALLQFTSPQSYQVATLANVPAKALENPLVFLSGFPGVKSGKQGEPTRKLTLGTASEQTFMPLEVKEAASLTNGYGLVYSNLSLAGMSGGPVLDSLGRVIGINAAAEAEIEITDEGQAIDLQLGNSLGVPIQTFLGQLTKANLTPQLLKVETSAPPTTTKVESDRILNNFPIDPVPSEGTNAFDWLNYGNQLWRLGRDSEAVDAFNKAIQIKPDFYQAYYALGAALPKQEAIAAYEKATQIQPNFYQAWRERASLLYSQEKTIEALASIDKAIAIQPDDAFLYLQRGELLSSMQRFQEATEAYNKSVQLKPSYLAYFKRGDSRFQLKDFQGAFDDANKAVSLQPENGLAYYTRGLAYNRLDNPQAAIADLDRCIQLMPYLVPAYYARSAIKENNKDYQGALDDLNKILEIMPDYADAYFQRGSLQMTGFNDPQSAIADFNKAIQLDPKNAEAYMRRGYLKATQGGDVQGALADISKAIAVEPNNPRYYMNRAQLLVSGQNFQQAIEDFTTIVQLQPDNADAYFQRAGARSNLNDFQGARQDLLQASQLYQAQGNTQQYETVQGILRMMK